MMIVIFNLHIVVQTQHAIFSVLGVMHVKGFNSDVEVSILALLVVLVNSPLSKFAFIFSWFWLFFLFFINVVIIIVFFNFLRIEYLVLFRILLVVRFDL